MDVLINALWQIVGESPLLIAYVVMLVYLYRCAASIARRWIISGVVVMLAVALLKLIAGIILPVGWVYELMEMKGFGWREASFILKIIDFIFNIGFAIGLVVLAWGGYKSIGGRKVAYREGLVKKGN